MPTMYTTHVDSSTADLTWDTWASDTTSSASTAWNQWVVEWHEVQETRNIPNGTIVRRTYRATGNPNMTAEEYGRTQQYLYGQMEGVWGTWIYGDNGTSANSVWDTWVAGVGVGNSCHEFNVREERRAIDTSNQEASVKKQEAEAKADAILRSWLTEEQRREYEETQAVTVRIDSVRSLRFKKGRSMNIEELHDGKLKARLCIHVKDDVPNADNMLAQMLFAHVDLDGFYAMANRSEVH